MEQKQQQQQTAKVLLFRLYQKTSKNGKVYWTGTLGASKVVVYENGYKRDDKDADLMVYVTENEKKEYPNKGYGQEQAPQQKPKPAYQRANTYTNRPPDDEPEF